MRTLFLVLSISAAGQLPARDVPQSADGAPATMLVRSDRACSGGRTYAPPSVSMGPTVFYAAGAIA